MPTKKISELPTVCLTRERIEAIRKSAYEEELPCIDVCDVEIIDLCNLALSALPKSSPAKSALIDYKAEVQERYPNADEYSDEISVRYPWLVRIGTDWKSVYERWGGKR